MVGSLLEAVPPPRLDRLAGFALEWLTGDDSRLRRASCQVWLLRSCAPRWRFSPCLCRTWLKAVRRCLTRSARAYFAAPIEREHLLHRSLPAAAQVLGILTEQEGRRFGRRAAYVLPPLAALLSREAAASVRGQAENTAVAAEPNGGLDGAVATAAGWQEPYAGLLLLEKLARRVCNKSVLIPMQFLQFQDEPSIGTSAPRITACLVLALLSTLDSQSVQTWADEVGMAAACASHIGTALGVKVAASWIALFTPLRVPVEVRTATQRQANGGRGGAEGL